MRELLMYDPTSPSGLRWKVDGYRNTYKAGDVAGCTHSGVTGYYQIVVRGKKYMSHRVVYFLVYGEWPDTVDHINGNRKDNRIENLRAATKRQNLCNLTKARGFYFAKQPGKFVAQICNYGKNRTIGSFDTALDARAAYLRAKLEEHSFVPGVVYP